MCFLLIAKRLPSPWESWQKVIDKRDYVVNFLLSTDNRKSVILSLSKDLPEGDIASIIVYCNTLSMFYKAPFQGMFRQSQHDTLKAVSNGTKLADNTELRSAQSVHQKRIVAIFSRRACQLSEGKTSSSTPASASRRREKSSG